MSEPQASFPKLSLIVPLYNEEGNVQPLQQEIGEALEAIDYELILVDDGSSDNTVSEIERKDRVRVIRLKKNSGQSAAMYAGMMRAKGEVIALIDGDLQNDPADIPKLMASLERHEADMVCGYRANRKDTGFKRIQSKIANGVRNYFTHDGVRDTGCTLKVMRQECRQALIPFTGMHRFIPALIKNAGYNVIEEPVNHRARKHGDSKYGAGLKRAKPATEDLIGVCWLNSRRFDLEATEE